MVPPGAAWARAGGSPGAGRRGATEAGRDPATLGMEGRVTWAGELDRLVEQVDAWRAAGATHLSINTMDAGLAGATGHLDVLDAAASALRLPGPNQPDPTETTSD
jgi:hypothetical protein